MVVPHVLRPRWTIKYVLSSIAVSYFAICLLFDMPFFSSPLPEYTGEYNVGTIDIEAPVEKRNISESKFRDTGKPAFKLETVLFSLFYPAVKDAVSSKPHHLWVSTDG